MERNEGTERNKEIESSEGTEERNEEIGIEEIERSKETEGNEEMESSEEKEERNEEIGIEEIERSKGTEGNEMESSEEKEERNEEIGIEEIERSKGTEGNEEMERSEETESSGEMCSDEEIDSTNTLRCMGFEVITNIDGGAFSTVRLAKTFRYPGATKVAIKILDCQKMSSYVLSKFVPRELDIIKRVEHPHIVRVYEVFELPNREVYIIMELASANLAEMIMNVDFIPIRLAKKWFSQLVSAVEYLHNKDIVHRDLKCDNILLSADGHVKLTDFGFSRFSTGFPELSDTFCGSPLYAAPELLVSHSYDPKKSDVWSLGIILYAMVTGKLPFTSSDNKNLAREHRRPITFPLYCNVEEPCRSFLSYILQYDPHTRPSVSEVAQHPWLQSTSTDESFKINELNVLAWRRSSFESSCFSNGTDMSTSEYANAAHCPNIEPVMGNGASEEVVEEEEEEIGCFCYMSRHAASKRACNACVKALAPILKSSKSLKRRMKTFFSRNNCKVHDSTSTTTQQQGASDSPSAFEHNCKHDQRTKRLKIPKFLQHIMKKRKRVQPM